MQKDKKIRDLQTILDIKDGKPMPRTTEKSEFNSEVEANRPTYTLYNKSQKGRMLTQSEMARLRRLEQIWPNSIQDDADNMRGFKVK